MISTILLNLTNDCNLRCRYCFVKKAKDFMTLETAKKAVDFLFKNNNNLTENFKINFFGGEPLLRYNEIIIPLVQYCKDNYSQYNYNFGITTNGILLNENNLKFFYDNNFNILLSMDGDQKIQNYNRPYNNNTKKDSFTFLYNNFSIIQKYFPNIEIRATITPNTVKYLFSSFSFFEKEKFKYVTFFPNMLENWTKENLNDLQIELQKITMYYLNAYSNNQLPLLKFNPYEKFLINNKNYIYNNCYECCGLGDGIVTINYDENIYTCQQMTDSKIIENNPYIIGNLSSGIDENKQKYLKSLINSNYHYCHANSILKNNDISTPLDIDLFWHNLIYQQSKLILLLIYINNIDINKEGKK